MKRMRWFFTGALLAVLFWGAAYLLAKAVLVWLPPFAAAGARYAGAALILLVVLAGLRLAGLWRSAP